MTEFNPFVEELTSPNASQKTKEALQTFSTVLEEAGIELSCNDDPHVLTQEQALIIRNLEKHLCSKTTLDSFSTALNCMRKKESLFRKALTPTVLSKKNDAESNRNAKRESLFKIFLNVSTIQTYITEILLDEIATLCSDSVDDHVWLALLINAFRYIPFVKDPDLLFEKLIDILEIAPHPAQLEILDIIPGIITDSQVKETARQLCNLLDDPDKSDLTSAVIDCLDALDLDSETGDIVQDKILDRMTSGVCPNDFPVFLSFLMSRLKATTSVPISILLKIRNAINSLMALSDQSKENETLKVLVFHKLQLFMSKSILEGWLNVISSVKSHSNHKPIDYLILFMIYKVAMFKRRIVEAVFKKRVQSGLFKIDLLEKLFEKYLPQQILTNYFNCILDIGRSLIGCSGDNVLDEFSSTLFKLLFGYEYAESMYRREILDKLVDCTGAGTKKAIGHVLSILSSFLNAKEKLQRHTDVLMRLLDKVDELELKDVKVVFEILCSLTFDRDGSASGYQNEIYILVRKQLSCWKKSIRCRGIIAAVVMARNIAKVSENPSQALPTSSLRRLGDLPNGPAKEAATLLELVHNSCKEYTDLTGLYYDQLASMLIINHHLDDMFLAWLYETVTADFLKTYVVESVPSTANDFELSFQYNLNSPSEAETSMGINIGGLTSKQSPLISVLASHFRLLRLLHYRPQNGKLSTIDALLGCAVVLPEYDPADLDSTEAIRIIDCLFHCCNWFREIISGFVTQKVKKLRQKVVKRLENLIEVENKLKECLLKAPEHKLPDSYFNDGNNSAILSVKTGSKTTKHAKKKVKSASTVDLDDTNINTQASSTQARKKKPSATKPPDAEHKIHFRDLDTDVILLLKYPLKLQSDDSIPSPTFTSTQSSTQQSRQQLNVDQLKFLLRDLVAKLLVTTQGKHPGITHLNEVIPLDFITDIKFILPNLDAHFKAIVKEFDGLLKETDGRPDLPEMFTTTAIDYKICFGLIMEAFLLIFSWTGFHHSRNLEVLKNMLKSIRTTDERSQTFHSSHRLIIEFIDRFANYTDQCLELQHAVYLVKIVQAVYAITTPAEELQKKISSLAEKSLSKRWYNQKGQLESGKNTNVNIAILVKAYLESANIETLVGLVGTFLEQTEFLISKEDCLPMLESIDKYNMHLFYNGLCNALLNRIKLEIQSLTNDQHLTVWYNTALTMQGLMTIAKNQASKRCLVYFLKKSIGILKTFLSHGIPILEIMLRSKPDEVVNIFKTMQTSTRFLHNLCCYSKSAKDVALMSHIPQFRKILESLVYRVEAALVANNCSSAFWLGNLKNKDLHGEEILSQSTVVTNDENESDELPSDDDDEDDNNDIAEEVVSFGVDCSV
ncbi:unnamed protein product [Phyllotreta striolata]|uniref:Fanconi anemia group D2 protein n=1 Tax=Phyllotreta striolata TaxID=444603 RepID=A0A9N9TS69_PHYSR|nr:unnamed protein product [Phyllotreta striolata]